jgi:hypothetical protein
MRGHYNHVGMEIAGRFKNTFRQTIGGYMNARRPGTYRSDVCIIDDAYQCELDGGSAVPVIEDRKKGRLGLLICRCPHVIISAR